MRAESYGASLVALALCACAHNAQMPEAPSAGIVLEYGALLDRECTKQRTPENFEEVQQEIIERLPQFQSNWDQHGAPLLREAMRLVGAPLPFSQLHVSLISCGLPSMSFPLLVNVRHQLRSSGGEDSANNDAINNLVLHEVLHRYVQSALHASANVSTPLWKKYKDRRPVVRNHLHVYAIERVVYADLGMTSVLEGIKSRERQFPSWADQQDALDIIDAEGAQAFVDDLRAAPAR